MTSVGLDEPPHGIILCMFLFPRKLAFLAVMTFTVSAMPCGQASGAAAAAPEPLDAGWDAPVSVLEVDLRDVGRAWSSVAADLDIIQHRPGLRARVLDWPGTRGLLGTAGLSFRVAVPDYGAALAARSPLAPPNRRLRQASLPDSGGAWNIPPEGQGSLAGYWNLDEIFAILDSVATCDTLDLVAELDTLGYSLQGRPIIAVGVFDHAQAMGTRPEVLLTSLHHAREPGGMQAILGYLLRLLDGYGTDPELTYLVENRETWFVPCVNPDGYVRNENTWINTGSFGFWRKNLRDNNGDTIINNADGVDLNRNYGYQWGFDNQGSSGSASSPTYRGPSAFSEPETQVMRDYVDSRNFATANNYHTHYELCLYPWGYTTTASPDDEHLIRQADAMTEKTQYGYGRGDQVLYPVNGEANDWMYGDVTNKPKVFSYTTEVGDQNDGFWPPVSRIIPLTELNLHSNVVLAYCAGAFLQGDSLTVLSGSGDLLPGTTRNAVLLLRNIGRQASSGGVTVTLGSGHPDVTVTDATAVYPDLGPMGEAWPSGGDFFTLQAGATAVNGTLIPLYLELSDGSGYVGRDTLSLRIGTPTVVFSDDASAGTTGWTATGGWSTETIDGNPAFSDSPGGEYAPFADARLTLDSAIDLSGAAFAFLRFRTQWNIEGGWDFARVEVSTDGGSNWGAVAGRNTRSGHGMTGDYSNGTQPLGVPGYDMNQRFWLAEELDLAAYVGESDLRLRFRITSDNGLQMEGWLLDDIEVVAYAPTVVLGADDLAALPGPVLRAFPNPSRGHTGITFTLGHASPVRLEVFDVSGRRVRTLTQGFTEAGTRHIEWDGRGGQGAPVPAGTYFLRLSAAGRTVTNKLLVLR